MGNTETTLLSLADAVGVYEAVRARIGIVVAKKRRGAVVIIESSPVVDAIAGEALVGHAVRDHVPPAFLEGHDNGIANPSGTYLGAWHDDFEFLRSDGDVRPIRLRVFPPYEGYYVAEMEARE